MSPREGGLDEILRKEKVMRIKLEAIVFREQKFWYQMKIIRVHKMRV